MHPTSHLLLIGACGAAAIVGIAAVQERGPGPGGPGGPVSRVAMALDVDHDGIISAAELRGAPAALAALDTNNDGRLTAEELRPSFNGAGRRDGPPEFEGRRGRGDEGGAAPASSPEDLADTLMAFDRNGDGRLDREEVPARFQGLFERADANKDGALTREELKQSASTSMEAAGRGSRGARGGEFGRGRGGMMGDPLVRALDTDGDATVSATEIAGATAALQKLDANQDGQLTADEFRPQPGRGRFGREGGR